jgi:hypothetical protein
LKKGLKGDAALKIFILLIIIVTIQTVVIVVHFIKVLINKVP